MTINETFPVGTFTAQVFYEGEPAETIEITIKEDGVVTINGPRWSSEGLLFKYPQYFPYKYIGIAQLKFYEWKIAVHEGYLFNVDNIHEFAITAYFQGGSITDNLIWQII
jgi:hypothetical protein